MEAELVEVTIETLTGAKYIFPDMPRDMVENLLLRSDTWRTVGRLILVNVSATLISMEARIVKCISWGGEVRWKNASVPQLQGSG